MSRQQDDLDFRISGKAQRLLSTSRHEYVHYIQAAGSSFLQEHAFSQLQLAVGLMRHGPRDDLVAAFGESSHDLSQPKENGLSCMDILEAGAVVEGYKLDKQDWGMHPESPDALAGFPEMLDTYRVDPARQRYHVAFDWLAEALGFEHAYRLIMPLTFIAFNTDDPVGRFTEAASYLGEQGEHRVQEIRDLPMVDFVDQLDGGRTLWLAHPERIAIPPDQLPPVTLAALHMVDVFGLDGALELLGNPWMLDREKAPVALKDAVAPLALVWSSAEGVVEMQLSDLTSQDHSLLGRVLSYVAVIGAAERLCAAASGDMTVYRFCPHTMCPHYGPAFCHRYYLPPPLARHHDTCNFISTLAAVGRGSSEEIWARWSLPPHDTAGTQA